MISKTSFRFMPQSFCVLGFFVMLLACSGCQESAPPCEGKQILYLYKGGPKVSEKNYKECKLHGPSLTFYKNGLVKTEAVFEAGKLNGWYRRYARDGELINSAKFVNGKPVEKKHYALEKVLKEEGLLGKTESLAK